MNFVLSIKDFYTVVLIDVICNTKICITLHSTERVMASQALFSHVVSSCLPEAVPTHLDRINEFGLGKVLIFSRRPRRFIPWSKKDLKFTGWSLSSLLQEADANEMKIATASSFLFDTSKTTNTVSVSVNLDTDPTLREALAKTDSKLLSGGTKQVDISADLGKMSHISTDLCYSVTTKKLHIKMDHPVIQEALTTGGTLFVISTIYEAERCSIKVSSGDSGTSSEGKGIGTVVISYTCTWSRLNMGGGHCPG